MGYLLAVFAAIFSSSKDLVSKRLSFSVSGTVSAFASFAFAVPFYIVLLTILYFLGLEPFNFSFAFFYFVLLRALTDTGAEWFKMSAYTHGDISLISCFMALSPLFLLITSPLITGDKLSSLGVLALLMAVSGTLILLYRPGMKLKKTELRGIGLALATAICFALINCFDRLAVKVASPTLSAFAMTLLAAAFIAPFALSRANVKNELLQGAKLFSLRAIFEVVFMIVKLGALQYLQAPYVVCIMQLGLLMSIIGGKVVFKEEDTGRRLVAGMLIASSVILIFWA